MVKVTTHHWRSFRTSKAGDENLKVEIKRTKVKRPISFISDSAVIELLSGQLICATILYITAILWPQSAIVAENFFQSHRKL